MSKKMILLSIFFISISFVTAQEHEIKIEFENYNAGDYSNATNAKIKEAAKISQNNNNSTLWEYGIIKQGSLGYRIFKFKNKGQAPLIISNTKSNCKCLVATRPRDPILPGKTGFIVAKYDTNLVGPINKSITVTSNAGNNPRIVLYIRGNVQASRKDDYVPPKKDNAPPTSKKGAKPPKNIRQNIF